MPTSTVVSRPFAASAGAASALLGAAAGHLVAGATDPATSPVLAIGSTVIDLTPTPVKEWAVGTFGTKDKPLLIGSVLLGALVLAAVAGLVARTRLRAGAGMLAGLAAATGAAALSRPSARPLDLLPALVTAAVGVTALVLLVRPGDRRHGGVLPDAGASRRGFLAAVALGAAALAGTGEWLARARTGPGSLTLPPAADPAPPLATGLEGAHPGISPLRTPTAEFYRVDTRLALPTIDVDSWRLTIDGDVGRTVSLGLDDLLAMDLVERDITLTCVSNEVGGAYVGSARWLGVPIGDLLDLAGIADTRADQLFSTDVDGFTVSTPLEVALDGRDTLVAVGMNGAPLPVQHGFPARLVTPGLYGFVGATKWLSRLTLTTYDEAQAYWTRRDWATDAPIKVAARIDTPRPLSTSKAGRLVIGGVAWAQHRGIARVEVQVDGGAWREATLGPDVGVDYWRQWFLPWDATPGSHELAARATTLDGEVQTAVRTTPFPDGASGIQQIVVSVA
ncbi:molybdopterin-dependent oxidoreductase [Nocardioides sp.]|uniref:molybdopterin-dependent oxidoreductase n=1 Tax=Nocardioides sp. TaxID=35761 RepID=UPI0035280240